MKREGKKRAELHADDGKEDGLEGAEDAACAPGDGRASGSGRLAGLAFRAGSACPSAPGSPELSQEGLLMTLLWSPPESPGPGVAPLQAPPGPDDVSGHQPVQEPLCVPGTLSPVQGRPRAPWAWGASPTEACAARPVPAATCVLTETPEALTIRAPGAPYLRKA